MSKPKRKRSIWLDIPKDLGYLYRWIKPSKPDFSGLREWWVDEAFPFIKVTGATILGMGVYLAPLFILITVVGKRGGYPDFAIIEMRDMVVGLQTCFPMVGIIILIIYMSFTEYLAKQKNIDRGDSGSQMIADWANQGQDPEIYGKLEASDVEAIDSLMDNFVSDPVIKSLIESKIKDAEIELKARQQRSAKFWEDQS